MNTLVCAQSDFIQAIPTPALRFDDQQQKAIGLLTNTRQYKNVLYVRIGKLADVQQKGFFYINVPGVKKPYKVVPKLVEGDIRTNFGLVGSLVDSLGQVVLTSRNGIVRGYLDLGADKYELVHVGGDVYAWVTLAPAAAGCSAAYKPLPVQPDKPGSKGAREGSCNYNPVRILITHTQQAANQTADINGLIDQAMWSFRAALINSGVYFTPQFVVVGQTNWTENFGSNPQNGGRADNDANNFADAILNERNRVGADLCICITGNDYVRFDGIAQNVVVNSNDNYACLIQANTVINGFGFSHELGHLFGLQHHDCDMSPNGEISVAGTVFENQGCVPYNPTAGHHGYRFEVGRDRWHTIMHYDHVVIATDVAGSYIKRFVAINHYSNPDVSFNGSLSRPK